MLVSIISLAVGAGERHVQCAPRGAVLKLGAYIHTAATRVAATEGEAESIGDADVTAADPAPGGAAGSSDADAGAAAADLAPRAGRRGRRGGGGRIGAGQRSEGQQEEEVAGGEAQHYEQTRAGREATLGRRARGARRPDVGRCH